RSRGRGRATRAPHPTTGSLPTRGTRSCERVRQPRGNPTASRSTGQAARMMVTRQQASEQLLLPAHLLHLVDLLDVLHVPLPLVLARQRARVAALDQDRDDVLVRDRVLAAVIGQ